MNRYIEHIINDLVRDTRINYERERIYFPYPTHPVYPSTLSIHSIVLLIPTFTDYCKDTYGLTEEEIDYVWDQYKSTIKDKITNR